jgi:hypothetical protein
VTLKPPSIPAEPVKKASWLRRAIFVALGLVLLLEIAYLVAANGMLRSGYLERALNRNPARFRIHWSSAWTAWPGRVHVRDLSLRGQTRAVRWAASASEATGNIQLLDLARRRLTIFGLDTSEVKVQTWRQAAATRLGPARAHWQPPLPSLGPIPRPAPRPPGSPRREPWVFSFHGVEATGVREVWVDDLRFAGGEVRAEGGFRAVPGREVEIWPSEVEVRGLDLSSGEKKALAGLRGSARVRIAPFKPRIRGTEVFGRLAGNLRMSGSLHDLTFLEPYLARIPGFAVEGGQGPFETRLEMARGTFLPGSRAHLRSQNLAVSLLGYRAAGQGTVTFHVDDRAHLGAMLERFGLHRAGEPRAYLWGRNLTVKASTSDLAVGRPKPRFAVEVDLPQGEIPDLRSYNSYLPKSSGFEFVGGRSRVKARLALDEDGHGGARLIFDDGQAVARYGDLALRGSFRMNVPLRVVDFGRRDFTISGLQVRVENGALEGNGYQLADWWGAAEASGWVRPGAATYLQLDSRARLRDSNPLLALFTERRMAVRVLKRVLDVEKVSASGRLTLARDRWRVEQVKASGGRLALGAELERNGPHTRGALLASYGRLDLGVELAGKDRRYHLRNVKRWFEAFRL